MIRTSVREARERSALCAAGLMTALSTGGLAQAQPAGDPAAELGEVIVTAERRASTLQRTPVAVSAVAGETLAQTRVDNIQAIQQSVPNLVVTANTALGQPYIRAVGNEILAGLNDSAVATHLDGVYVPRGASLLFDFYDLDRVEVVRGPQGTLYGRNATGGAINVITRRPAFAPEGAVSFTLGAFDQARLAAAGSAPLVADALAVRAAILIEDRDGYQRNLFDGRRLLDKELKAGRLSTRYARGPWEAFLGLDYALDRSTGAATREISGDAALAPVRLVGGASPSGFWDVNVDTPTRQRIENAGANLTLRRSGDALDVTSITAFRSSRFRLTLDQDATQIAALTGDPQRQDSDSFTQELQLSGASGSLRYIVGAFYFTERVREHMTFRFGPPFTLAGLEDLVYAAKGTTEAGAIFAQGDYALTEAWTLTVGARLGHERKRGLAANRLNFAALPLVEREVTSSPFTPKLGLQYQVSPTINAYASITKGFKSGGVNSVSLSTEAYGPETLWAYEAGLKAEWFARRLRTNLAAFHYDYSDMQVNQYTAVGTLVENAGSATIRGFELEFVAAPVRRLRIEGQAAYLDARFDEYRTINPDAPAAGMQNLAGYRLPRAPRWSASLAAQYAFDLGDALSATLRAEHQYRGRVFYSQFENPLVGQKAYALTNAFLTIRPREGGYSVQVWGRNLGDVQVYQFVGSSPGVTGVQALPAAPRTYGVTVSHDF